jgi:hypothetical protein
VEASFVDTQIIALGNDPPPQKPRDYLTTKELAERIGYAV